MNQNYHTPRNQWIFLFEIPNDYLSLKAVFLIALWLLSNLAIAQSNEFLINGRFKVDGGSNNEARIVLEKDGRKIKTLSGDARFEIGLDYQAIYIISFIKEGFVTKKLLFDTHVPEIRIEYGFVPFQFTIEIFEQFDEVNTVMFNQPVGKISFSDVIEEFDYDTDYTQSIQAKMQEIMEEVYVQKEEKAKRIEEEEKKNVVLNKKVGKLTSAAQKSLNSGNLEEAIKQFEGAIKLKDSPDIKKKLTNAKKEFDKKTKAAIMAADAEAKSLAQAEVAAAAKLQQEVEEISEAKAKAKADEAANAAAKASKETEKKIAAQAKAKLEAEESSAAEAKAKADEAAKVAAKASKETEKKIAAQAKAKLEAEESSAAEAKAKADEAAKVAAKASKETEKKIAAEEKAAALEAKADEEAQAAAKKAEDKMVAEAKAKLEAEEKAAAEAKAEKFVKAEEKILKEEAERLKEEELDLKVEAERIDSEEIAMRESKEAELAQKEKGLAESKKTLSEIISNGDALFAAGKLEGAFGEYEKAKKLGASSDINQKIAKTKGLIVRQNEEKKKAKEAAQAISNGPRESDQLAALIDEETSKQDSNPKSTQSPESDLKPTKKINSNPSIEIDEKPSFVAQGGAVVVSEPRVGKAALSSFGAQLNEDDKYESLLQQVKAQDIQMEQNRQQTLLKKNYPKRKAVETEKAGTSTITHVYINRGDYVSVYKKVEHNWGGVFFFIDERPTNERFWEHETQ